MTAQVVEIQRVPADEWTDDHLALAAHLAAMGYPPGEPEWIITTYATFGPDGEPVGMGVTRAAGVSNTPLDQ